MPPRSLSMPTWMRRFLVSSFLADVTQQIHSFRANGVISVQSLSAAASDSMAFRKSGGNLCIGLLDAHQHQTEVGRPHGKYDMAIHKQPAGACGSQYPPVSEQRHFGRLPSRPNREFGLEDPPARNRCSALRNDRSSRGISRCWHRQISGPAQFQSRTDRSFES